MKSFCEYGDFNAPEVSIRNDHGYENQFIRNCMKPESSNPLLGCHLPGKKFFPILHSNMSPDMYTGIFSGEPPDIFRNASDEMFSIFCSLGDPRMKYPPDGITTPATKFLGKICRTKKIFHDKKALALRKCTDLDGEKEIFSNLKLAHTKTKTLHPL